MNQTFKIEALGCKTSQSDALSYGGILQRAGWKEAVADKDANLVIVQIAPGAPISGAENPDAASRADVVFLTVPYEAQRPLLEQLRGALAAKVVVSVIAPMRFERGRGASAISVEAGSAAQEAQQLLPDSLVVAAFQTVSAETLQEPAAVMGDDVIVCSDHPEAKALVMGLVQKIHDLRPVDGGALANSKYVEQITPLLVNINRIYKSHAGIKIVGL